MMNGEKIRVLVADDSAFMRKVLLGILDSDGAFEVVGEARDGRETVEKSAKLKPDVITMDINMPHMDGLQATEVIMSTDPRPIVIVSSESREGAHATLRALELGAIDFLAKPSAAIDLDMSEVRGELVRKLRIASKVRVVRNLLRSTPSRIAPPEPPPSKVIPPPTPVPQSNGAGAGIPIAVLGASTGGPATLMKLLPEFAADFPGALLVIQHMPGAFTAQFAEQLASVSRIPVKQAQSGDTLCAGQVYVCPGDCHLRVAPPGRIVLDDGPRIAGYRPSIDVTLESVASLAGTSAVVAILTGMGNDGARGVMAIQENGGSVLAQDETTSVIFGMPAEAIKTGAVAQVLPLEQIASAIARRMSIYRTAGAPGL
ncbi:MAG TPA: chemotaxis response regulator protein-glutamate methylesterase [Candidatus Saccharimonadales bacterium]|nr:chemotaxis response regulator protein-glutamate methylesterase [Candidatus Saccharimonadales bacterium]